MKVILPNRQSIEVSQQADVVGFIQGKVGSGSMIGAIFSQLPTANHAIDDLTLALARHVFDRQLININRTPRDRWLEAAYAMIQTNQPPLPHGYSAETNVDRLIHVLHDQCQRVLIGVLPLLDGSGMRDARSVAEWMNRVSKVPTTLVHGTEIPVSANRMLLKSTLEERLINRLEQDTGLQGLFQPNVVVFTVFQTRPRVDLLWRAGRFIVEIDSYRYHSSRENFADDRQRDYETGATGYLTLRLTDQEVSRDLHLAIEKIRRCVHIRKRLFHV